MGEVKAKITIPIPDFESLSLSEVIDKVASEINILHNSGDLAGCIEFESTERTKLENSIVHLEAEIERVSNGFIVSGHNTDDRSRKTFFKSLEDLSNDYILEDLRDTDRTFKECDESGRKMEIAFQLTDIE